MRVTSLVVAALCLYAVPVNCSFCKRTGTSTLDCSNIYSELLPVPADRLFENNNWLPMSSLNSPLIRATNALYYQKVGGDANNAIYAFGDGGVYMAMLIDSGGESVLFDCPESTGWNSNGLNQYGNQVPVDEWVTESVQALTGRKITKMFFSHDHWDHVGNCGLVYTNNKDTVTQVWGTTYYNQITADRNQRLVVNPADPMGNIKKVPLATNIYYNSTSMYIGNILLEFGILNGHDKEDGVFYIAKQPAIGITQSVLMNVDVLMPGWTYFLDMAQTMNINGYRTTLVALQRYNADITICGHYTKLGTPQDVTYALAYYDDILKGATKARDAVNAGEVMQSIGFFDKANKAYGNTQLFTDSWVGNVKAYCSDWVLDPANTQYNYNDVMTGAQVFTESHCYRMFFGLLLNEDYVFVAPNSDCGDNGLSAGAQGGIAVGVILAFVLGIGIGVLVQSSRQAVPAAAAASTAELGKV